MSDFMKRYGKRMFSLFAVLLMVAACLVFLDLDPEESEAADANSYVEFAAGLAVGNVKLTRDIEFPVNINSVPLNQDTTIDLNGYTISTNNLNCYIFTNGNSLTIKSTNKGAGVVDVPIGVTADSNPQTYKPTEYIVINDGVWVKSLQFLEQTFDTNLDRYSGDETNWGNRMAAMLVIDPDDPSTKHLATQYWKLGSLIINDGIVGLNLGYGADPARNCWYTKDAFMQYTEYHSVDYDVLANALKKLVIQANVSSGQSIYLNDVKYDDLNSVPFTKSGGKFAVYNKTIDTSTFMGLTPTVTTEPTDSAAGTLSITNYFSEQANINNANGNVTWANWYKSVNGAGYVKCDGYSGNFSITKDSLVDTGGILRGANKYTYYAEITIQNNMVSKTFTTDKVSIYTAPLTPTSAGIAGQENAVTGASVTFTGAYNVNSNNIGGNVVRAEYKWQKSTDGTEWTDIGGVPGTKLTYQPSTSVAGTTYYKFLVRSEGKGGLYSDWKESAPLTFIVGEYNSPVIGLSCASDITEVNGYNVNAGVSVTNSSYYDSVSYQWYYEQSPGTFVRLSGNSWGGYTFSGVDTAAMTVTNSSAGKDIVVHCQVTGIKDGYKRVANSADVSISFIDLPAPVITGQPQNANLTMTTGTHALAVYASVMHGDMTYQWQTSADGTAWSNIDGATNFNYFVDKSVPTAGTYYRCQVTNTAGTTNSGAALIVVTDNTVLNATLVTGLEVTVSSANPGYEIDNTNRTLVCHVGDIFTIGFTASVGNATDSEGTCGTDWRNVTGVGDDPYYIHAFMAGTFVYYGRYWAEYDNGVDDPQTVTYDATNDERMTFTVTVLPLEDDIEVDPVIVDLGSSEDILIPLYKDLRASGGDVITSATTWFRGNHQANSFYHYASGYSLFLGIPNGNDVQYICFSTVDMYESGSYVPATDIVLDTSEAKLQALGITTLDGVYDAYIVMHYQQIVNENVDGVFIVKNANYEGHHFTITVKAPCQHEHVTTTYTFDYTDPDEPEIFIFNKCDECGADLPGSFIRISEPASSQGMDVIQYAATCTEDGMLAHKHFTSGIYDVYYVLDNDNHWVECTTPQDLVIKATHQYQAVPGVAATCTADGTKDHYKCTVCNQLFMNEGDGYYGIEADAIVAEAFHKNLDYFGEQAANCMKEGVKEYYFCSHCNKYFTDSAGQNEITDLAAWKAGAGKIEKTDYHTWGPWTSVQAATATEDGIDERVCLFNTEHKEQKYVTASGQHYDKDESGAKVFSEDVVPGDDTDLTDLFAAAKTAGGKVNLTIGKLSISFDGNAVNSLGAGAVTINAKLVTQNPSMEGAEAVIDVTMTGASFGDGKATVSFPFNKTIPDGKVPVVYLIDGTTKTKVDSTFENGKIIFDVPHFSTYAVFFEDAPSNGGNFPIWIVIVIVVVVVAAAGVGAFFFMKNKKAA